MTPDAPPNNTKRIELMTRKLTEALAPTSLDITDDSHKHVGHPGAVTGMGHFTVKISSEKFTGKSMLEQHRMIYDTLGDMMQTDIHALKIKSSV